MITALPASTARASGARRVSDAEVAPQGRRAARLVEERGDEWSGCLAAAGARDLAQRAVRRAGPDTAGRQSGEPQRRFERTLRRGLAGRRNGIAERARIGQLDREAALRAGGVQRLGDARGEDGERDVGARGVGALALGEQQLQDAERLAVRAQDDREHGPGAGAAGERGRAVATGDDRVVVAQRLQRERVERALADRVGEARAEAREHVQPILVEGVQERAVGAAGSAREPRGDARDGCAVSGGRERLARDVEQLGHARIDAGARARERECGLRGHVAQELALGLAERVGARAQDLQHAHGAVHPADGECQRRARPAVLQSARDGGLECGVEVGFAPAHRFLEAAVEERARARQLGLERRRVDVDGPRDEHAARGVVNAHEHRIRARELGRHACEQRERPRIVALAGGSRGLIERGELRRQAARPDGRVRRLERPARDLGDAVGECEVLRRERLAGIATAEDHGDAGAVGVAQREGEHRRGPAVTLERDVGRHRSRSPSPRS